MINFSKLDDAFSYLESFTNFEKLPPQSVRDFKLDRMEHLLSLTGDPHKAFRTYHLAGSKGKGSTAAFLTSILYRTGEPVGLYTSPHVSSYKERITFSGRQFEDGEYLKGINFLAGIIENLSPDAIAGQWEPTTFELLTLLAFIMFRNAELGRAVIETGIGGRLDATNVISPEAVCITPIELEHTDILGSSIEKIAREKAGIIKPRVPVFIGFQENSTAEKVLLENAREKNAPVYNCKDEIKELSADPWEKGTKIRILFRDGFSVTSGIRLLGDFQAENAALASLCARHVLGNQGLREGEIQERIHQGLQSAHIPGRMEIISRKPPIILDGAHTPASVKRLTTAFTSVYPGKCILIFGAVLGKDIKAMAEIIAPAFTHIIISRPGSFKKSDPGGIFEEFLKFNPETRLCVEPKEALDEALRISGNELPILAAGSFYMIGEIRKLLV